MTDRNDYIIVIGVIILILALAFMYNLFTGAYPTTTTTTTTTTTLTENEKEEDDGIIKSKVIRVIDGDTIQLENKDIIRFAIVNTPERYEYGYKAAKEWTEYRCLGKDAIIDLDNSQPKGSHNRLVGAVYCGSDEKYFVNQELIQLKLGKIYTKFCDESEFKDLLCY
jgi:endonuclease YncB( thermonuclease family)